MLLKRITLNGFKSFADKVERKVDHGWTFCCYRNKKRPEKPHNPLATRSP